MPNFKVGDKVRLVGIARYAGLKKNDIYTIISLNPRGKLTVLLSVPEGTQHIDYDGTNPGWWIHYKSIELCIKPGEQLLFDFMNEDDNA